MSELDQIIEQKMKEIRGLGTPTLQKIYWAMGSVVGAIAVFSILLPFIDVLRFEFLQLILISFSVVLIIVLISFRPGTRQIDWSKVLEILAEITADSDEEINYILYNLGRSSPSKERDEVVQLALKTNKFLIVAVRMGLRLALIEGKSDLANDFQKEIDELREQLKTLERFLTPSK